MEQKDKIGYYWLKLSDEELREESEMLYNEIEAVDHTKRLVDTELYYRQNPEVRPTNDERFNKTKDNGN